MIALWPAGSLASEASLSDVKIECAQAYEQAQRLRKDGLLVDARKEALVCAQEACPTLLSDDCSRWMSELDGSIPSHVFELREADGSPVAGASVSLDGGEFARIDGLPVAVDPGSHTVVFRSPEGTEVRATFDAIVGRQNVLVRASLPEDGSAEDSSSRRVPTATWVFGGIGVAGLGAFAVLAGLGSAEQSDLESECTVASPCDRDRGRGVKTMYAAADISLAVGVASAAAGLGFWLAAPRRDRSESARIDFSANPTASSIRVSGTF